MDVHVGLTGPEGEPLGSWTTTEAGEHIVSESVTGAA